MYDSKKAQIEILTFRSNIKDPLKISELNFYDRNFIRNSFYTDSQVSIFLGKPFSIIFWWNLLEPSFQDFEISPSIIIACFLAKPKLEPCTSF